MWTGAEQKCLCGGTASGKARRLGANAGERTHESRLTSHRLKNEEHISVRLSARTEGCGLGYRRVCTSPVAAAGLHRRACLITMSFDSITHAMPHLAPDEFAAASQVYERFKDTLSAGQNPSVRVVKATFPELCLPDEGSHQRVSRWVSALWPTTRVTAQLVAFFVHDGVDSKLACLRRFNLHSIGEISIVSVDRPFFHRQREHFTWPNNNVYKPAHN